MDRRTFIELREAAVTLSTVLLKFGAGMDTTTEENARRLAQAERLLMNVLKDEYAKDPALPITSILE